MYYLELSSPFHASTYRLQRDKTWRNTGQDESITESDLTTPDSNEIVNLREDDIDLMIDGQQWRISPTGVSAYDSIGSLHYDAYIIRTEKPRRPSFGQMIEVIASADDSDDNRLVLLVTGLFAVRDFKDGGLVHKDPSVAVRHSSIGAGLGYFGPEAAKDLGYFRRWFNESMVAWIHHLRSGECNLYANNFGPRRPEEIEQELEELA